MHERCWICGRELNDTDSPESVEENKGECALCYDQVEGYTHYYCHPESDCVWKTEGRDQDEGDGLVEEIEASMFYSLRQKGWSDGTMPF